jgi:cytochrome c
LAAGCGNAGASSSTADLALGERAYQKCYSCHALEPGAAKLEGPSLQRVVGRPIAAERGFDYSPALRRFAQRNPRWTPQLLDRYVADPEAMVPQTSMNFHGIEDPAERRALIEYLARARR